MEQFDIIVIGGLLGRRSLDAVRLSLGQSVGLHSIDLDRLKGLLSDSPA
jgi:hypothetical protein